MAPRLGFTLEALRRLNPAACESDVRLGWKKDDETNVGLLYPDGTWINLRLSGLRELELLAEQIRAHIEECQRQPLDVVEIY